jgi:NADH-quinone oxidoreductase subunit H
MGASEWWQVLLALLVWPGLIGGTLLGWLFAWVSRKLTAWVQGRMGPPFYQPFFDFIKLLGKEVLVPVGISRPLFFAVPVVSAVAVMCALALIPAPGNPVPSFRGDLILFLYLVEVPPLCGILAGYVSRSLYGEVGAAREAMLSAGHNLPLLAAVVALGVHAGSFRLASLTTAPFAPVHAAAAIAFLLAVPARARRNPFSIPNAEQEIVAGTLTEFSGVLLALFELTHHLELVAQVGLFTVLFMPAVAGLALAAGLYLCGSMLLVVLVTLVGSATARVKVHQAFRFYWSWGALAGLAALVLAVIG